MIGSTQAATNNSTNYQTMALTTVDLWHTYRMPAIVLGVILLIVTIILFIRKSSWAKWFMLLTILTGGAIIGLDWLNGYVTQAKKEAIRESVKETLLTPVRLPGKIIKGIFGFGR